jgi:hypothetical protein
MEGDTGRKLTCERRGATDRGEYRQAAGVIGQGLNVVAPPIYLDYQPDEHADEKRDGARIAARR